MYLQAPNPTLSFTLLMGPPSTRFELHGFMSLVDLWSTGIVTYICAALWTFAYPTENITALIRETTSAKFQFHERYWRDIALSLVSLFLQ
ncbi:hypothetical protein BDQ17DRAFT_966922 [Cyathus striatus]|nr:hypothetical protein BDQ17DRAFT_966922 [Cyathus striatus]